ncbi:MAG: hypothetical protein ACREQ7_14505 [Candidatus Binatia bacterium]
MEALEIPNSSPSDLYYRYDSDSATVSEQRVERVAIILHGEIAEGCILHQPIIAYIERDDDGRYILSEDLFAIYGQGRTINEAWKDYGSAFCEYYHIMKKHAAADEPSREAFDRLSRYISIAE